MWNKNSNGVQTNARIICDVCGVCDKTKFLKDNIASTYKHLAEMNYRNVFYKYLNCIWIV